MFDSNSFFKHLYDIFEFTILPELSHVRFSINIFIEHHKETTFVISLFYAGHSNFPALSIVMSK